MLNDKIDKSTMQKMEKFILISWLALRLFITNIYFSHCSSVLKQTPCSYCFVLKGECHEEIIFDSLIEVFLTITILHRQTKW